MLTEALAHRFFHVETRYRYDWQVTLVTGEVLLIKAAPLIAVMADMPVMVVVDAKWQGPAFGAPALVDRLLGHALPLSAGADDFLSVICTGIWEPYAPKPPK